MTPLVFLGECQNIRINIIIGYDRLSSITYILNIPIYEKLKSAIDTNDSPNVHICSAAERIA
jgi:hypothetical protein